MSGDFGGNPQIAGVCGAVGGGLGYVIYETGYKGGIWRVIGLY
ncbi:hypothetical protein N0O92_01540 [Alkalihalobacillus sp. MEB130]|nr:hypothetical protein [Alkalihalobacillus sp. MEB130]MDT8858894.1 hypothetical protein [Alkalihalobacillus sp. MEB130]